MIKINSGNLEFHLSNEKVSYIFNVLENGELGHLYYGKKIRHRDSFEHMVQTANSELPITPNVLPENRGFSLDTLKQEYPAYGTGDYREPAISILQENGSRITNFKYKKYEVVKGKPALKGLPSTYVESDDEAETLLITLEDELIGAELVLTYTIFRGYPVITRNALVRNNGEEKLKLERVLSMNIEFADSDFQALHLSGTWSRERHVEVADLTHSKFVIESKRGTSSANNNPFLALKRKNCDENSGEVYGFNFVYSGNFIAQAEKNHVDLLRVNMGINPFNFGWVLEKDEEFQSPEVVMVYSDTGLNGMSHAFHNLYKKRVARGKWRDEIRPVLINNWEATYFDFDEEKIVDIAAKAKELGVELFVLDDGWFGSRNNDYTGLGDWWVNLEKIPSGISGLSKRIEDLGMSFGLWFEPEMVNKNSELYKTHPNWILQAPGRANTQSRNQHTLDLGREDVRDYLYEKISKILRESSISYIKWDMNRPMTEIWSEVISGERQGEVCHRYILGLYDLLERITSEFPDILFESCASGGNRFDAGMLYYMPQAWTSDDTDAVERIKIQYGTSMVYPTCSMGAHVSAVPNHQTRRVTPLKTRGNVAFFGAFGYELDLNKISDEEKEIVKEQIKFFKENRKLLQFGDFYRLISPFENKLTKSAWMVVNPEKTEAIVAKYEVLSRAYPGFDVLKLVGLDQEKNYEINSPQIQGNEYFGDELMSSGLMFTEPFINSTAIFKKFEGTLDSVEGDYKSCLIKLIAKK